MQKLLSNRQTVHVFLISMNKYDTIASIDLLQRYTSKRAIDQDEIDVEHCIVLNLILDMNKLGCRLSIELNYSINIGASATTIKWL